jgi:hypothetical protein
MLCSAGTESRNIKWAVSQAQRYSCLLTMLPISVLPFIALCMCLEGTSATTPDVNVTVARPSTDIVKVNIQIDIGVQDTPNRGSASYAALSTSSNLQQWEGAKTVGTSSASKTLCAGDGSISAPNTTAWLPTTSTQRLFTNSTASPLATGSFRTPSQINLASLLDSSAGAPRVDMLSAWSILGVLCVMAALF